MNTTRKFKHYDTKKLTEVGFCPSVKNQVEAFTQAGKILAGAQDRLYHFNDDNLDEDYQPEDVFQDKIENIERGQQLMKDLEQNTAVKEAVEKQIQKEKDLTESTKSDIKESTE